MKALLIVVLCLGGCVTLKAPEIGPKWELKAECGVGPSWSEGDRTRMGAACAMKFETTLIEGGN
jgi:hypothetical protein